MSRTRMRLKRVVKKGRRKVKKKECNALHLEEKKSKNRKIISGVFFIKLKPTEAV